MLRLGQHHTIHQYPGDLDAPRVERSFGCDPLDLRQEYPSMGLEAFANDVVRPFTDNH